MKNKAYAFAREVDQRIEALSECDYLQRNNRGKILLEEWYPISRLALHFKQPGLEVEVEAFDDSGGADGRIWITGFQEQEFDVQATYCSDYKEALRMELLVSEGSAPGTGDIYRDPESGEIHATQGVVDYYEYIDRIAEAVIKRFRKKSEEYAYRSDTILVVAFHEPKLGGLANWKRLLLAVEDRGGMAGSNFTSVYLFNSAINEIQKAA